MNDAARECKEKEEEMKKVINKIIEISKSNYRFKANVNLILVIVGIVLIANPIAFTWLKSTGMLKSMDTMDLTNLNYFLGGIGIIAFVTTFFNRPQKQMTVAIGDLAQLLFICMMYQVQFHTLLGRIEAEIVNGTGSKRVERDSCIRDTNEELYVITSRSVKLIEDCMEKYAKDDLLVKESKLDKSTLMQKATGWMDGKAQ